MDDDLEPGTKVAGTATEETADLKAVVPPPKMELSFALDPFNRFMLETLIPNSNPPGRWAAMNAVRHMHRGWMLRESDHAMAAFRSITAEEEAATALFRALIRLGYPQAERLQPRNHKHKNAVTPFLEAVRNQLGPAMAQAFPSGFNLSVNKDDVKPRMTVMFNVVLDGVPGTVEPIPPLELRVTEGPMAKVDGRLRMLDEKPVDFGAEIAKHVAAKGGESVKAYLAGRANLRNQLLYAAPTGYPVPREDTVERGLIEYRANTLRILKLFCLVDAYPQKQMFVRQCLRAFLKIAQDPSIEVSFD